MRDFFLPHPKTHQKAHLLTWHGLVIYLFIFIILQVGLGLYGTVKPGVLGVDSQITQARVIELTNQERAKNGLGPVKENSMLDAAAAAKAQNMFEENYWAHYSPSGKDPWGFIQRAGYHFSYAGENLARNFNTSEEVVQAWMDSPSHRANLLGNKYQDIGIAVAEGTLNGQKTTLVVQEFGTMNPNVSFAPDTQAPPAVSVAAAPPAQSQTAGVEINSAPTIDPYAITKGVGMGILLFIAGLLLLDMYILHRRQVNRISSRHLSHLSIISVGLMAMAMMHPGSIL
jgi:hypothetical protein